MAIKCVIKFCKNKFVKGGNIQFYRFPMCKKYVNEQLKRITILRRKAWIKATNRNDLTVKNIQYMRLCSDHFTSGRKASTEDILHPDWIPTQNLNANSKKTPIYKVNKYLRQQAKILNDKELAAQQKSETTDNPSENSTQNDPIETKTIKKVDHTYAKVPQLLQDRDLTLTHNDVTTLFPCNDNTAKITQLITAIQNIQEHDSSLHYDILRRTEDLLKENLEVISNYQAQLSELVLDIPAFANNDAKTRYYTGLPCFATFSLLMCKLKPFLPESDSNFLTKPQMLLLTLIKLRLGLHFKDLGYRFNISESTASRIFCACIYVLYCKLKNLLDISPRVDSKDTTIPASLRVEDILRRKFLILGNKIPRTIVPKYCYTEVSVLDQIVAVCGALNNLCSTIVFDLDY